MPVGNNPCFDDLAAAGGTVLVVAPDDMRRLAELDQFNPDKTCPFACWAAAYLPIRKTDDTLSIPQDAEIIVSRDPAKICAFIAGRMTIVVTPDAAQALGIKATSLIDLDRRRDVELLMIILLTSKNHRMARAEKATPQSSLRLYAAALSKLAIETLSAARSYSPDLIQGFGVGQPDKSIMLMEAEERGSSYVFRHWERPARRRNLSCQRPVKIIHGLPRETKIADAAALIAEQNGLGGDDLIAAVLPRARDEGAVPGRLSARPSAGARLCLLGIAPAWIGRSNIATAMNVPKGRLTLEYRRSGQLMIQGWYCVSNCRKAARLFKNVSIFFPVKRFVEIQANKCLDWARLSALDPATIRTTMIETFITEINPRLPLPFVVSYPPFSGKGLLRTDNDLLNGIISDFVGTDPDFAATRAGINWVIDLPEDSALGSPTISRRSLDLTDSRDPRPSPAAMSRLLLVANAALLDISAYRGSVTHSFEDGSELAFFQNGSKELPGAHSGRANPVFTGHEAAAAHRRMRRFWNDVRLRIPESWRHLAPDGSAISPKTLDDLDRRYLVSSGGSPIGQEER